MRSIIILGEKLDIKMSHSFANKAACPRGLKLNYVDKDKGKLVRVAAERGKGAHSAISFLMSICIEKEIQPKELSNNEILDAVTTHTAQCVVSDIGLILEWVKLWAENWVISENYVGHEEKVALDIKFNECDFSNGSYRGVLDLIEIDGTHAIVTDWKSQPHILPKGELDNPIGEGTPRQLSGYAWLASKLYPHLKTFTVRIFYLRYGFYHESDRTLEDLSLYEEMMLMQEQKISEIDNWDPIPGKHCQYCDWIHSCPLAQDLSNDQIISEDQAVAAARRVHVMDSLSKELKLGLKDYINENGNVCIGDEYGFGFQKKTSPTWPSDKAEAVLENHSRKLSEVANVNSVRMKKFIKEAYNDKDSELVEDLYEIEKPKHYTRFEGYRIEKQSE